ncbi:MAG: chromosome segregation protein SMC, partial [Rhodospirillales bacterium]|nr:chromosome segregation protein SMC [Rhodospirillales bacterium]
EAALTAARAADATAQSARARAQAETQALAEILAVKDGERWPPMLDQIVVPDGLETALGAALGDALSSAADPTAARHWRDLPALPAAAALPGGAIALSASVQAPPALARALSQIGLIDAAAGDAAQAALAPGQILVSREGAVWRWDGYTILAGTKTEAAVRLAQRNRLIALRAALARAEAEAAVTATARQNGEAAAREANAADHAARAARREAEQNVERLRAEAARLVARAASEAARLSAVEETHTRQSAEKQEADAALAQARAAAATLPDLAALRAAVNGLRESLTARRNAAREAQANQALLAREQAARATRRAAIGPEIGAWQERATAARDRAGELTARRAEAEATAEAIRAEPDAIAARRAEAIDALDGAEGVYRRAATALQEAGEQARASDRAARAAEARLATLREEAVRAEGLAAQAAHGWGTIAERILERLGADAALPDPPVPCNAEAEDKARRKLDRLIKEREEMGPVNLRAEIEAGEVETQIATITTERAEITTAIAKLRGSIGHLNREGRERLASVFAEVDRHFQSLFSRMFGGGRAHLALVGSDDPLVAGLEIYAQPPGKKLATLSLLSGGEQALTALSLIFAVFRCNPAPVCVLDEVDAPLDDANVERFCALLEDMVREAGTRFLVVTHHPLTMARMDRLYGVTMQERGVSRVLSVDLGTAAGMVDAPRMAAE